MIKKPETNTSFTAFEVKSYTGSNERVRVIYDRAALPSNRQTGKIAIINAVTGSEFYNYIHNDLNKGRL